MRLSDAFENKAEIPAVECIAKFVNINYGHNKELMANCKRLHDYSYFINCVRKYLRKGYGQKDAVYQAMNECIVNDILKDVLLKHRAEVMDMFLTKFDKKMYEEALRLDARADALKEAREEVKKEMESQYDELEKVRKTNKDLNKTNEDLSKTNKDLSKTNEDLSRALEEQIKGQQEMVKNYARNLREKGIPYEVARDVLPEVREEDLKEIYGIYTG